MAHRPSLILSLSDAENEEMSRLVTTLSGIANVSTSRGGIPVLIDVLRLSRHDPDIIFVELDGHPRDIHAALDRLKDHVSGVSTVYGFGRINDVAFYRSLMETGFRDYFILPFSDQTLDDIARVVGHQKSDQQKPVIGFVSLAGGVGTSTVALNFAHDLAEQSTTPVMLLHPQPTPYNTQFNRYDSAPHDIGGTPRAVLIKQNNLLSDDPLNISRPETLADTIDDERMNGNIILIDIGTHLSYTEIMSRCDHFVIIGEPDYRSLLNAKPLNDFLSSHYPFAARHFALTQLGLAERIEFGEADVQSLVGDKPLLLYTYDPDEAAVALAKPVPLLPHKLLKDPTAFEKLADICGITLKPAAHDAGVLSNGLQTIREFLRKRKAANG